MKPNNILFINRNYLVFFMLFFSLFLTSCSAGYYQKKVSITHDYGRIKMINNLIWVDSAPDVYTQYQNHYDPIFLKKFIRLFKEELRRKSFELTPDSDMKIHVTEFTMLNGEVNKIQIDLYEGGEKKKVLVYESELEPYSMATYYKREPTLEMAVDRIISKMLQAIN